MGNFDDLCTLLLWKLYIEISKNKPKIIIQSIKHLYQFKCQNQK